MRAFVAICAFMLVSIAAAQAEKRIFVIASNTDGYGVDRCLATGAHCGEVVATAYCRAREFNQALSFRKVDRDDTTGTTALQAEACRGSVCDALVAIECTR